MGLTDRSNGGPAARRRRGWATALTLMAAAAARAAEPPVPRFGTECGFNGQALADGAATQTLSNAFCSGGQLEQRGTTVTAVWTGEELVSQAFDQHALTSAAASGGLGVLGAYSHSQATSSPMAKEFLYPDGSPGIIENTFRASARSGIWSSWWDTITINPGAVYGRVMLRYTLKLSGDAGLSIGRGDASIYARLIADDLNYADDPQVILQTPGTVSFQQLYWPGSTVVVRGFLSAASQADAGRVGASYIAESEAMANAANTAGFQIEVLDFGNVTGASYTSASGRSYATMVPEPATWAQWALGGLALLGVAARRRRAVPGPGRA